MSPLITSRWAVIAPLLFRLKVRGVSLNFNLGFGIGNEFAQSPSMPLVLEKILYGSVGILPTNTLSAKMILSLHAKAVKSKTSVDKVSDFGLTSNLYSPIFRFSMKISWYSSSSTSLSPAEYSNIQYWALEPISFILSFILKPSGSMIVTRTGLSTKAQRVVVFSAG